MILYKYRNIGDIKTKELDTNLVKLLSAGEFFLSDPRDFNDPFDCAYELVINGDDQKIRKYYEGLGSFKNKVDNDPRLSNIEEIKKSIIDNFQSKDFSKVYCLSKTHKNPLMWAHYGQKHYGVCVGFKTYKSDNMLCLNISDSQYKTLYELPTRNLVPLFEVDYRIDKLKPIDLIADGTNGMFQHAITKSLDWKYEEEMRLVFPSAGITRNPIHIKRSEIAEIIFGLRTPEVMQEKILKIVSGQNTIAFYKMEMIKGSYEIQKKTFA